MALVSVAACVYQFDDIESLSGSRSTGQLLGMAGEGEECVSEYNSHLPRQVWLTKQDPPSLDPSVKYLSKVTFLGRRYVTMEQVRSPSLTAAASSGSIILSLLPSLPPPPPPD